VLTTVALVAETALACRRMCENIRKELK